MFLNPESSVLKSAVKKVKTHNLAVSAAQLKAHSLAGGDAEKVVDALILADRLNVNTNWQQLSAIDLAGRDVTETVSACGDVRELVFDRFSPDLPDKIRGFCRDHCEVYAKCTVRYRLPVSHVFSTKLPLLQEHLSARTAIYINTSDSYTDLQASQSVFESKLLVMAKSVVDTVEKVSLNFRQS